MDELILNFIKENMVTIGLAMAALKVIAQETPWATDDKIVKIFTNFLNNNK